MSLPLLNLQKSIKLPPEFGVEQKTKYFATTNFKVCLRVCLHVSESAYELPYDSMHDSLGNRIGIQFFFCHQLQKFVYTFQQKKSKIILLDTFGTKSYTESYGDLYGKSHV
jgi:hypothetical protein